MPRCLGAPQKTWVLTAHKEDESANFKLIGLNTLVVVLQILAFHIWYLSALCRAADDTSGTLVPATHVGDLD